MTSHSALALTSSIFSRASDAIPIPTFSKFRGHWSDQNAVGIRLAWHSRQASILRSHRAMSSDGQPLR
jgi:hypothetical protein